MGKEDFFIATIITVLILRSLIFFSRFFIPETHLMFKGHIIHHFWFGFLFIMLGLLISKKYETFRNILLGIGAGPIADEFVFMMFGDGGYKQYWGLPSVSGMFISFIFLFIFRRKIVKLSSCSKT